MPRNFFRFSLVCWLFFMVLPGWALPFGSGDTLIVTFSHSRNFYHAPFTLQLTANKPDAKIFYTIDCSRPTSKNGLLYQSPVIIEHSTVLKAIALSENDSSEVITQTFIFPDELARQGKTPEGFPLVWGGFSSIQADYEMDPAILNDPAYKNETGEALQSIPVVSLSMNVDDWFNPQTGLYVGYPNSDVSREKAVTAEFLFPEPNRDFAVECGVQNQGGTSIVNWKVPKQSMRLLFKEMYGPKKLKQQIFPDSDIKSINTLVLDGFLYSWVHPFDDVQRKTTLFFRDQLASDMQNKMGWNSFHGIYVHLFINGLYWGLYDLHERPDEEFLAEYLHAGPEDFDIIKHNPNTVVSGSNVFYNEMLSFARKGLTTAESLGKMKRYLDIPAFIDYMILNFYLGNYDWAHQNYYAAYNRITKTGFRFYTWDAEHVMRYSDVNYNNINKNDKGGPTEIHTLLKSNAEYRMMFADAVYRHFFNGGMLSPESFRESFLYRTNEIDKAVMLESARWGDFLKTTTNVTYTRNDHWLPEVNKVISEYIPLRRDIVLNQLIYAGGLFPSIMPPEYSVSEIPGKNRAAVELRNTNMVGGIIYYTIDGSDPRAVGGEVNGLKYSGKIEVIAGTLVKSRVYYEAQKVWSALAEKVVQFEGFYGDSLVISEIMYHPENGYPEFVELSNIGSVPVDLNGFRFSNGIYYHFQSGTILQSGKGLVLTNDTVLFYQKYGFKAAGQFTRKLDNAGEIMILQNRFGQTTDSVPYSDTIPWPVVADGDGMSIELINSKSDNSLAQNWKTSEEKYGTPFKQVEEIETEAEFFPNPFSRNVSIKVKDWENNYEKINIEIFNLSGRIVKRLELSNQGSVEVDTYDLPTGVYIFRIWPVGEDNNNALHFKAVKTTNSE